MAALDRCTTGVLAVAYELGRCAAARTAVMRDRVRCAAGRVGRYVRAYPMRTGCARRYWALPVAAPHALAAGSCLWRSVAFDCDDFTVSR